MSDSSHFTHFLWTNNNPPAFSNDSSQWLSDVRHTAATLEGVTCCFCIGACMGKKVLFCLIVTFFQAKVGQRDDCFAKVVEVQTPEGVICLTLTGAANRGRVTPSLHAPQETFDCPKTSHHAGATLQIHSRSVIQAHSWRDYYYWLKRAIHTDLSAHQWGNFSQPLNMKTTQWFVRNFNKVTDEQTCSDKK